MYHSDRLSPPKHSLHLSLEGLDGLPDCVRFNQIILYR